MTLPPELREAVARIIWERFAPPYEEVFTGGGEYGLCASDVVALLDPAIAELVEGLRPFADFVPPAYVPDNHTMTNGSPLAKRQVTAADFRRADQLVAKYKEAK